MAEVETSAGSTRIGGAKEGTTQCPGVETPEGRTNHDGPARENVRRGFFLREGIEPGVRDPWRRVKDVSMGAIVTAIAVLATVTMLSFGTALRGALADLGFGTRSRPPSVSETSDGIGLRVRSAAEIQDRIDRAAPGAVIEVAPGRYRGSIDFRGKGVTVIGREGADRTIIEGDGARGDLVTIRGVTGSIQPTLEGFTVRGARGASSAALRIERSDPIIARCIIEENETTGALLVQSRALIDESVFRGNRASPFGGGLQSIDGSPVIIACVFIGNHAVTGGGAMHLQGGGPMIVRTRIEGNGTSVGAWGGGIYADDCELTIMDCEIVGNGSSDEGGGVFVRGGRATIERCDFSGNRARSAWSLLSQGSRVTIRSTRFCGEREWNLSGDGIAEQWNEFDPDCGVAPPELSGSDRTAR